MDDIKTTVPAADSRKTWVEPSIRTLDIGETSQLSNLGADVGGNAAPDCQRS
ncbi:hypothetical protein [Porphyrobacter sp. ULC335]|uniref:hypothetical protein n=1 Tax=Porphyrobacter sp. ULC335 TaxID=2854260 RepID=UPI00221E9C66|nr:hypothetical protein [Porphyrobacter sp. ULC335]UYV15716.1 hypothetical protein KVF90_16875 [Porphyrobacter sp. ULC335]